MEPLDQTDDEKQSTEIKEENLEENIDGGVDSLIKHEIKTEIKEEYVEPYQIIVADAADAVSVNFSGRCKFLQI